LLAVIVQALARDVKVVTPFGKWSKSCTYAVDSDTVVVDLLYKTVLRNKITKGEKVIPPCSIPQSKPSYNGESPRLPYGWAAYAYANAPSSVLSYNGSWVVPTDPAHDGSQVLFLFTGLQNNYDDVDGRVDVTNIIQPVLQFGVSAAGGGDYWALASWYVDSNDNAFWSNLTQTTAGNVIQGNMVDTGDEKTGSWAIISNDTTANVATTLNIMTNTTEPFAFVTLEVYTVSNCNEYPAGSVEFTDLVFDPSFTPTWTPEIQKDCDESVTVGTDGSVTINF